MLSFPHHDSVEKMADLDIRYVPLHGSDQSTDSTTFAFDRMILDALPPNSTLARGDAVC
jgi:hypothetical protein